MTEVDQLGVVPPDYDAESDCAPFTSWPKGITPEPPRSSLSGRHSPARACLGSGATASYEYDYSNRTGRACQVCGKPVRPIRSDPDVLDKTPVHLEKRQERASG